MPVKIIIVDASSETAGHEALTPERLALPRLTRADVARVREMTTEAFGGRFYGVAA